MKKPSLLASLIVGLMLFGCTSNIHFEMPDRGRVYQTPPQEKEDKPVSKAIPAAKPDPKKPLGMVNCPPFKLPHLGKVPDYPEAEIEATVKKTGTITEAQAEKIKADYVLRLRKDGDEVRRRINAAYAKYLKDCRQYDADHPDE